MAVLGIVKHRDRSTMYIDAQSTRLRQLVREMNLKIEIIAGRTPGVSCAVTMTMNALLGHPKMTKEKNFFFGRR